MSNKARMTFSARERAQNESNQNLSRVFTLIYITYCCLPRIRAIVSASLVYNKRHKLIWRSNARRSWVQLTIVQSVFHNLIAVAILLNRGEFWEKNLKPGSHFYKCKLIFISISDRKKDKTHIKSRVQLIWNRNKHEWSRNKHPQNLKFHTEFQKKFCTDDSSFSSTKIIRERRFSNYYSIFYACLIIFILYVAQIKYL